MDVGGNAPFLNVATSNHLFMLNPDEIDRGMMVPDMHDMRFITRRRRAQWKHGKRGRTLL